MLNIFEFSDSDKMQEPEFKLYPELQFTQTVELIGEHCWQLLAVHLLTVSLTIFRTGLGTPETAESM